MPNAPQGVFRYPGLSSATAGVLSCSWTNVLGISPSMIRVSVPPRPGVQPTGTASFIYNGEQWDLPNCLVDDVSVVNNADGTTTWDVTILDRRWAWQYGQITGEYNARSDGAEVIPERDRSPRQLATLCLEAMAESNYDVSALPTDDRPYVNWELAVPAKALADLCDLYGCTVSLTKQNRVKIVQIGVGQTLPPNRASWQTAFNPANIPSKLSVVSAKTRWQMDLELEPVGYDIATEKFVPIKDLTYKPGEVTAADPTGWGDPDPQALQLVVTGSLKEPEYAQQYVWRRYRVVLPEAEEPEEGDPIPPLKDALVELTKLEQILPLLDTQVDTELKDNEKQPKPAVVWGKFVDGRGGSLDFNTQTDVTTPDDYSDKLIFEGSWSIDAERGFVDFSEPVYLQAAEDNVAKFQPPKLWLRTSINLYDNTTRESQRYKKDYPIDLARPTQPEFLTRDDVTLEYKKNSDGEWESNETEVVQQMNYYATAKLKEYQSFPAVSAEYIGFVMQDVDGAIRQVTLSIGTNGEARTSMARNMESDYTMAPLSVVRQRQKLVEALRERDREQRERTKRERQARRDAKRIFRRGRQ